MYNIYEMTGFPAWAISYAYYGDCSGLTDEEIALVDDFMDGVRIISIDSPPSDDIETYFEPYPLFGLACDCVDITVTFDNI